MSVYIPLSIEKTLHILAFESQRIMPLTYTCKTDWEYIGRLIEVINSGLPEEEQLCNAEKDCLCALVLTYRELDTIMSETAKNRIKELTRINGRSKKGKPRKSFTDNSLSRYKSSLARKGWLESDGKFFRPSLPFRFPKDTWGLPREMTISINHVERTAKAGPE